MLHALADDVELALEGLGVGHGGAAADEHVLDRRLDRARGRSHGAVVGGHRAPPEERLPFLGHDGGEQRAAPRGLGGIAGKEDEPGSVALGGGESDPERGALAREEGVRDLDEDARAVTRVDFTATGAAVEEVLEHLEGLGHDGVRPSPLHVHHEADAAGIVLVARVVEPLSFWKPRRCHL